MPEETKEKSQTSRWFCLLGIAVTILAIGLIVGLVLRDDDSATTASVPATSGNAPTKPPNNLGIPTMTPTFFGEEPSTPSPVPPSPTCLPDNFSLHALGRQIFCSNGLRREAVYLLQLRQVTAQNILQDPSTPQGKAYAFLVNYDSSTRGSCSVAGLVNRYVLMTLYFATNGDSWSDNTGWCEGSPFCSWTGVDCSNGLITGINLESNNLVGTIPQEIYVLNELQSLNLFANSLSGPIPNMRLMTDLREIDFQQNLLTGDAIPLNLPSSLTSYKVSGNKLSGTIPASIDNWTRLRELWAGRNEISGTIPTRIGNLINLESLYLFENSLKGSLPSELGRIPLEEVWLSNNFFETEIPEEFLFLGSLTLFRLENNIFSGSIATWIGLLTNLQDLRLNSNNLEGSIPPQLGMLTDLVELRIGDNFWAGNLPNIFSNLNQLETFEMSNTEVAGQIPSSLFSLPSIENVYMSETKLVGSIPSSFRTSQSLKAFHINDSPSVSGAIPSAGTGGLQSLEELLVQGTGVTGAMPDTICALRRSHRLDVLEADCEGETADVQCEFPDCCTRCY